MKVLILGGTQFLGRALVESLLSKGHQITLFNRGKTNPNVSANHLVTFIQGDRDGEISNLGHEHYWDVVIDCCGYIPRIVQQSVDFLKSKVGAYIFISSISVYKQDQNPGKCENAPLMDQLDDPNCEDIANHYGELKAMCERIVKKCFGDSAGIIRAGLIVGPWDPTNRFTYWLNRIRKGNDILAPGDGNDFIQFIDVRDLADFIVLMCEQKKFGEFNVTGPELTCNLKSLFEEIKNLVSSNADFNWIPNQMLLEMNVSPWIELPLWDPTLEFQATMQTSFLKALNFGLQFRPLKITVEDTLNWYDMNDGVKKEWKFGLEFSKETELLKQIQYS
jgi:2'-hydroxyisoflavone reductase